MMTLDVENIAETMTMKQQSIAAYVPIHPIEYKIPLYTIDPKPLRYEQSPSPCCKP